MFVNKSGIFVGNAKFWHWQRQKFDVYIHQHFQPCRVLTLECRLALYYIVTNSWWMNLDVNEEKYVKRCHENFWVSPYQHSISYLFPESAFSSFTVAKHIKNNLVWWFDSIWIIYEYYLQSWIVFFATN